MKAEKNDGRIVEFSVPEEIEEGINVKVTGSNIAFDRYHELLKAAVKTLDIIVTYFFNPHPFSNVTDAGRYVRLHTNRPGPVHARAGPIARMAHLLEDDRSGYRKLVQDDRDHHGRRLPGY